MQGIADSRTHNRGLERWPIRSQSVMNLAVALSAAATLVATAFGLSTFERWLHHRTRHQAAWTVSLAMFAVATSALWAGLGLGWDETTFRLFYLFGAVLNVPVLALGTLYLLGNRRLVDRIAMATALWLAMGTGVVFATPIMGKLPAEGLPAGADHLGVLARSMATISSAGGATVLVGGAVWSLTRLFRAPSRTVGSGSIRRLALANSTIALGTLVLGYGGASFDQPVPFALTTTVGITLIFSGFLLTNNIRSSEQHELDYGGQKQGAEQ